ncbi:hypothetical protein MaudCBS49596_006993 [Microsporum audouinii]
MRATWLTYLAVAGLSGGASSAMLPQDWSTGSLRIGHETAVTTDVRYPNPHMTKAAFTPFQNATILTQAATSAPILTTTAVDEPTLPETSFVSYTKTLSLINNSPLAVGNSVDHGESTGLISKAAKESCLYANTVATNIKEDATVTEIVTVTKVITTTEVALGTTESIITATSPTKQPTLPSSAVSEPSPTAGSIIRIPTFVKAQITKAGTASHSIGPGLSGWNASTFVTTSTREAFKADSLRYEVKHVATAVPALSMHPQVYERQVGDVVIGIINGKVVSWKNEWIGQLLSSPTSIKTNTLILISDTPIHKPTSES